MGYLMEYLMTYGWAILIIIVVVAALHTMSVFNTSGCEDRARCIELARMINGTLDTIIRDNCRVCIVKDCYTIDNTTFCSKEECEWYSVRNR